MKEKVLLGKWSAIAMLELQRIQFAGWALACQVVFERKGFAREMVSNCNVRATTYTVCWVGTDQGAAPARLSSGV